MSEPYSKDIAPTPASERPNRPRPSWPVSSREAEGTGPVKPRQPRPRGRAVPRPAAASRRLGDAISANPTGRWTRLSEERDLRPEIERIKERKDGLDVIDDLVHAARDGGIAALDPDDLALAEVVGHLPAEARGGRLPHAAGAGLQRPARLAAAAGHRRPLRSATAARSPTSPRGSASSCTGCGWRTCRTSSPRLDEVGLTSAQACGDVWRNVVGCPLAGVTADEYFDSRPVVHALVASLRRQPPLLEPPPQVQGRRLELPPPLRAARDQRHRPGRRGRARPRGRLRRVGRRRPRRVRAHGPPARRLDPASTRRSRSPARPPRCSATTATASSARAPARSSSSTSGAPSGSAQALEERLGRELADGPPPAPPLAPMRDHVGYSPAVASRASTPSAAPPCAGASRARTCAPWPTSPSGAAAAASA